MMDGNIPLVIDRQKTAHGEIQLQRRDHGVYEIIYNGVFLMASYNDHSERILARAVIENLPPTGVGYQILVGGLGMGFTLQEIVLCPRVSHVAVVEIEQAVINWNRCYFAEFNGGVLEDPRIALIHADLFDFIFETDGIFDAVLLDVDNGPNWLAIGKNRRLYSEKTTRRIERMLSDQGILATWSSQEDSGYRKRLDRIFSRSEEIRVQTTVPKPLENLIYMGMVG